MAAAWHFADVVQLVERHFAKVEAAGSSPAIRSKYLGVCGNGNLLISKISNLRSSRSTPANRTLISLCHKYSRWLELSNEEI